MKQSKQNSVSKRRERLAIIAEILQIALYGAKKTHIIYQANLSFQSAETYLRQMEQAKLVAKYFGLEGLVYKTTKKGVAFMMKFFELNFMLESPHPNRHQIDQNKKSPFHSTTHEL
jgi:predicted transcriptional regulator